MLNTVDQGERIPPNSVDLVIVGAGAAGLAAAIFAARRNPRMRILVLEGARKPGAKILVSGGGRCNVTNRVVTESDFWGGSRNIIRRILRSFSAEQAVEFFRELGVSLHEEEQGKLFPDSNSARTVLDALFAEVRRLGIQLLTDHRVVALERHDSQFVVRAQRRALTADWTARTPQASKGNPAHEFSLGSIRSFTTPRVALATGGRSLPKTGSDGKGYELAKYLGHSLVPTTPALAPLVLNGDFHAPLSGISHEVILSLQSDLDARTSADRPVSLRGSLLWTHFGISGPVVLDISRHWHRANLEGRPVHLSANFLPDHRFETADRMFVAAAHQEPRMHLQTVVTQWLPARVAAAVLANLTESGIRANTPLAHVARDDRHVLLRALLEWPLSVRDSRGYSVAEVTAGGVPLHEINPSTMESRKAPGLYLVGEILDVDGRIGGFNFQWAWSSAHVAARAMSSRTSSEIP